MLQGVNHYRSIESYAAEIIHSVTRKNAVTADMFDKTHTHTHKRIK